jgi:hypothetical protein
MLATYLWNRALCEALYPALQGLEVALRNSKPIAGIPSFLVARGHAAGCFSISIPSVASAIECSITSRYGTGICPIRHPGIRRS